MKKPKGRSPKTDPELAVRKKLTFAQAEGLAELPRQLDRGEVSKELRAILWSVIYASMVGCAYRESITGTTGFRDPWLAILRDLHVFYAHLMIDEFEPRPDVQIPEIKRAIQYGSYTDVLDLIQWILRHPQCPSDLPGQISRAFRTARCAYDVYDGDTIAPVSSDEETAAFMKALSDTARNAQTGARMHLKRAAEALTKGEWAPSIRESIHAVEAAAKVLAPDANELGPALTTLAKKGYLHGALRSGFLSLYGFTSDEKGIRHALIDKPDAAVDEVDAQYMLGACAAFVSYLLARARRGA